MDLKQTKLEGLKFRLYTVPFTRKSGITRLAKTLRGGAFVDASCGKAKTKMGGRKRKELLKFAPNKATVKIETLYFCSASMASFILSFKQEEGGGRMEC